MKSSPDRCGARPNRGVVAITHSRDTHGRWPYKFVHALLRIVHEKGNLNIQDQTPATSISEKDADGYITVTTPRGTIRTKAVMHATVGPLFLSRYLR